MTTKYFTNGNYPSEVENHIVEADLTYFEFEKIIEAGVTAFKTLIQKPDDLDAELIVAHAEMTAIEYPQYMATFRLAEINGRRPL